MMLTMLLIRCAVLTSFFKESMGIMTYTIGEIADPVLKIGVPLVLSPGHPLLSTSAVQSLDLFFSWLNHHRGGININGVWHKAELLSVDTNSTEYGTEVATRYLLEENISFLLGPDNPAYSETVSRIGNDHGAVVLHPMAYDPVNFEGRQSVFGMASTVASWRDDNLQLLWDMGIRNVAMVEQNLLQNDLCVGLLQLLEDMGFTIVKHVYVAEDVATLDAMRRTSAQSIVTSAVEELANYTQTDSFDAVVDCVESCDLYFSALLSLQIEADVMFTAWCMVQNYVVEDFLGLLPRELIAHWMTGVAVVANPSLLVTNFAPHWTRDEFTRKYREVYHGMEPKLASVAYFAAAGVLVEALEAAGSTDPQLVTQALWQLDTTSIYGPVQFKSEDYGQNSKQTFSVVQFQYAPATSADQAYTLRQERICLAGTEACDLARAKAPVYPWPPWNDRLCHDVWPERSAYGYTSATGGDCVTCPFEMVSFFNFTYQRRLCQMCEAPLPDLPALTAQYINLGSIPPDSNLTAEDDPGPCVSCGYGTPEKVCFFSCVAGKVPGIFIDEIRTDAAGNPVGLAEVCVACEPGTRQVSAACVSCPPGHFSPPSTAGSTSCDLCPRGTYSDSWQSTACTLCSPGSAMAIEGVTACADCTPGRYTSNPGESSCHVCEIGRSTDHFRTSACDFCRPGTFSAWSGTVCTNCTEGTYNPAIGQGSCLGEPLGAQAPQQAMRLPWNNLGYYIALIEGYNMTQQNQEGSPIILDFCKFLPQACLPQEECLVGHVGVQCLACEPGFSRNSGSCFQCHSKVVDIVITIIIFTIGLVFSIFLGAQFLLAAGSFAALHPVLLKQMCNFILCMSVATQFFDAELRAHEKLAGNTELEDTLLQIAREIATFTDWGEGLLPSETPFYSVGCLVQPTLSAEEESLVNTLVGLNMTAYKAFGDARAKEVLMDFMARTELRRMLFWTILPGFLMFMILVVGYVVIVQHIRASKSFYSQAVQFYTVVYRHTLDPPPGQTDKHIMLQAYPTKLWTAYVREYFLRVWGIWSPVSHARRYLRWGIIDFVRLKKETSTVMATAFFISYGSVLVGISRSFDCVSISGQQRLRFQSELPCDFTRWFQWAGIIFYTMWGVVSLMWLFYILHYNRNSLYTNDRIQRRFGFLTNGYKSNFCYWELVIFFRKFLLCSMRVFETGGMNLFLTLGVTSLVAQLSLQPYDPRSDNLLNILESMQLVIWMVIGAAMKASERAGSGAGFLSVAVILVILHYGYMAVMCLHLYRHMRQWWVKGLDKERIMASQPSSLFGRLIKRLQERAIRREQSHLEHTPYVCYDLKYGWVTVVGSRADEAVPTYIAKGLDAVEKHEDNDGKPLLSQAPAKPPKLPNSTHRARKAGPEHMYRLQEILQETICFLASGEGASGPVSASLLDFAIRAAFVLDRQADGQSGNDMYELDEQWLRNARLAHDPLYKDGDEPTGGPDEYGEEEEENEAAQINKCKRLLQLIGEELVSESDFADMLIANRTVSSKKKTKHQEVRYGEMVKQMFSQGTFRRGIPLDHIQASLLLLQRKPRGELKVWMDRFEREWVQERVSNEQSLVRMAGGFKHVKLEVPAEDSTPEEMRRLALPGEEVVVRKGAPKEMEVQTEPMRAEVKEKIEHAIAHEEVLHARRWVVLAMRAVEGVNVFKLWSLRPMVLRLMHQAIDSAEVVLERSQQRRKYLTEAREAAEAERDHLQSSIEELTSTLQHRQRELELRQTAAAKRRARQSRAA